MKTFTDLITAHRRLAMWHRRRSIRVSLDILHEIEVEIADTLDAYADRLQTMTESARADIEAVTAELNLEGAFADLTPDVLARFDKAVAETVALVGEKDPIEPAARIVPRATGRAPGASAFADEDGRLLGGHYHPGDDA